MSHQALKVIRPFVKIGSAIAPKMTGNAAFRLFCTPPKAKVDEKQRKMTERAEARLAASERARVPFEGGEVETYLFRTGEAQIRGTILLVHGWTGQAAFMSAFVEPLTSAGFDVLALDMPAHGKSSGKHLHVPLGVAALHAVRERFGPWYAIVAHSFGGAVATSFVAGAVEGFPSVWLDRLVLIATPSSMPALFRWFGDTVGLSERGHAHFNANVMRLAGRALDTFEGEHLLRSAKVKTLVLHAPDDKEVAFSSAETLAKAGTFVTMQPMPGLGHRRILYAPTTVAAVTAFMQAA
ncbi:MAG: alpha/beta hydrolase [Beijerinckiaceae bacterium]